MRFLRQFWLRFLSYALAVKIRMKIMGIALGLILLLGLSVTIRVRIALISSLEEQLEERGVSIARDVAARSTDLILTGNLFTLYELLKDTMKNNNDVRYTFVLGKSGELLAHTFPSGFPQDLLSVNPADPGNRFNLEVFDTEEGTIHDIAVPILEGKAGVVHVGLSERRFRKTVAWMTYHLLIATAMTSVVGVVAAYLLTTVLARPIFELVDVAGAVGRGDFYRHARVYANDEIGHLSVAFNTMIENLRKFREELWHKEQMRVQLLDKVISAQEEERKRVARELHDQTGQSLTSLMVGLEMIESSATVDEAKEKAVELRSLAAQILDETHKLSLDLRPTILDDLGFVSAIQRYAREFTKQFGISVDYHTSGFENERRLPPPIETALYRIVQEALTNVAKYADPHNVSILLEHLGAKVRVIVEDDGKGFDAANVMNSRVERKLGLFGMEERATLVGGRFTIESSPGSGTTVYVEIPVGKEMEHEQDQTSYSG